jgi:hypothetical protein
MKIQNMTSNNGNKAANQFVITDHGHGALGNFTERRNQFLNETTKETQAKIDSGEYILTNLNG